MARRKTVRKWNPLRTFCRLEVMHLEDRLPPGDALRAAISWGAGLGLAALPTDFWGEASDVRLVTGSPEPEQPLALSWSAPAELAAAGSAPAWTEPAHQTELNASFELSLDTPIWIVSGLVDPDLSRSSSARHGDSAFGVPREPSDPSAGYFAAPDGGRTNFARGTAESPAADASSGQLIPPPTQRPPERPSGNGRIPANPKQLAVDIGPDCTHERKELVDFAPGYGPGEDPFVLLPNYIEPGKCPTPANTLEDVGEQNYWVTSNLNYSEAPIRYHDGTMKLSFTDLESDGFGSDWGLTRNWTNNESYASGSDWNGYGLGTVVSQLPYFVELPSTSIIAVITSGVNSYHVECTETGCIETTKLWNKEAFEKLPSEFIMTDTAGNRLYFHVTSTYASQLKKIVDPYGHETTVVSYSGSGKATELQRSENGVEESYLYTYDSSNGQLKEATLRRRTTGNWLTVRKAVYDYYTGGSHGIAKNLKTVEIKDAGDVTLHKKYYRYWTNTQWSTSMPGYAGGLKYAFEPDSYSRMVKTLGDDLDNLSDAEVAPFADYHFQYWEDRTVKTEVAQGRGNSRPQTYGLGTFNFTYAQNPNAYDDDDHNHWAIKTVEELPDHTTNNVSRNIVFTNNFGEVVLKVVEMTTPTGVKQWPTYYRRDDQGRVLMRAFPSAFQQVNNQYFDESLPDLLGFDSLEKSAYLKDSDGLFVVQGFTSGTGQPDGYLASTAVRKGENGAAIALAALTYTERDAASHKTYPMTSFTTYSQETTSTGARTINFEYLQWHGSTHQAKLMRTKWPGVSSTEHGPGTSDRDQRTVQYDANGRAVWMMDNAIDDPDRVLHHFGYDTATGALTKSIFDVDSTLTSEFSPALPVEGTVTWSTPSGHGLHIRYLREVDDLGRAKRFETTSKEQSSGNVTHTIYDDRNHEMRIYPG